MTDARSGKGAPISASKNWNLREQSTSSPIPHAASILALRLASQNTDDRVDKAIANASDKLHRAMIHRVTGRHVLFSMRVSTTIEVVDIALAKSLGKVLVALADLLESTGMKSPRSVKKFRRAMSFLVAFVPIYRIVHERFLEAFNSAGDKFKKSLRFMEKSFTMVRYAMQELDVSQTQQRQHNDWTVSFLAVLESLVSFDKAFEALLELGETDPFAMLGKYSDHDDDLDTAKNLRILMVEAVMMFPGSGQNVWTLSNAMPTRDLRKLLAHSAGVPIACAFLGKLQKQRIANALLA